MRFFCSWLLGHTHVHIRGQGTDRHRCNVDKQRTLGMKIWESNRSIDISHSLKITGKDRYFNKYKAHQRYHGVVLRNL